MKPHIYQPPAQHRHPSWVHAEADHHRRTARRARVRLTIGTTGLTLSIAAIASMAFWGA